MEMKFSEPAFLAQMSNKLLDSQSTQSINIDHFTKVLGMEWNTTCDTVRPVVWSLKYVKMVTKRALLLDIAKQFDVLS